MFFMSKILHTGNIIIFGFILAALSMLFLVYKSTQVHFDMSTEGDYYAKEKEFNGQLVAQRNAIALGDDFIIDVRADSVHVHIPATLSQNINHGTITFYSYANSTNDKVFKMTPKADGHYAFAKKDVMVGYNYNVKVAFNSQGKSYYKESKAN